MQRVHPTVNRSATFDNILIYNCKDNVLFISMFQQNAYFYAFFLILLYVNKASSLVNVAVNVFFESL